MTLPQIRNRRRLAIAGSCNMLHDNLRLVTQYLATTNLNPPKRPVREHSKRSLVAIAASIEEFGIVKPILIDDQDHIVAGYGVWLAAKEQGIEQVPVIRLSHLNPAQLRLFTIADNQIPTLSAWDDEALALELGDLSLDLDLELKLEITGFSMSQIDDRLAAKPSANDTGDADDEALEPQGVAMTREGDMWECGQGRLICGDALKSEVYDRLLGEERAQLIVSDPPYNEKINGNVSGRGRHREFAMASGEMTEEEFTVFLATAFILLAQYSVDGSIHYQFMDWRHMREMLAAGHKAYAELKNLLVWKKSSAGMGTFYRSQHELIFVWKNGSAPHINNFGLGETGRWRSNVLDYPGCAGFRKGRKEDLAAHPTVKNTNLVADLIRDCSKRGGIVLDPFGGSGTTLLATERTGRRGRLIELDPLYCDVAVRRWQKASGKEAILVSSGQTFAEVEAERLAVGEED